MARRRFRVPAVVASDGTGTFYTPYFSGSVESIQYVKTDYADTVDFTITSDATGQTLWTESNVTAAKTCMPRGATHTNAGVASLYASGGTAVNDRIVLASDRVKIVIAQGGTSTTGLFYVTTTD